MVKNNLAIRQFNTKLEIRNNPSTPNDQKAKIFLSTYAFCSFGTFNFI
jgi:hypothetical protein